MNKIEFKQNHPLNPEDTCDQTYGCRHTNSDICSSHSLDSVCAFVRADKICKKPPRSWKSLYEKLLKESLNE